MLTFQCDTGYMPQKEVTSTCLSKRSWVPIPECEGMYVGWSVVLAIVELYMAFFISVVDCGAPPTATGIIIDPFNNTKFSALITFHCEENNNSMTAVCGSDGEWIPNPASPV